jgi:chromosome segregation ATPase
LARELTDLETSKVSLEKLIAELDVRIDVEFKEGILKINATIPTFFCLDVWWRHGIAKHS